MQHVQKVWITVVPWTRPDTADMKRTTLEEVNEDKSRSTYKFEHIQDGKVQMLNDDEYKDRKFSSDVARNLLSNRSRVECERQ